jgi:hypothetical protein
MKSNGRFKIVKSDFCNHLFAIVKSCACININSIVEIIVLLSSKWLFESCSLKSHVDVVLLFAICFWISYVRKLEEKLKIQRTYVHTFHIVQCTDCMVMLTNKSKTKPHCTGNSVYIFLFWELRGLSPNFHIYVFVSDLYIPRIGPHISSSRKGRPIVGIYNSLTDT